MEICPNIFHFCTAILSIFGNAPLTLKQDTQHVSSTIPYFLLLFFFGTATPFIYGNAPWTLQQHPQHCHQPSPIFFLIFPIFYCHFSLLHSHNSHICKFITQCHRHPSPIFFLFFPYFIAIFRLKVHLFPYLEVRF
jgi:hypothetical protein